MGGGGSGKFGDVLALELQLAVARLGQLGADVGELGGQAVAVTRMRRSGGGHRLCERCLGRHQLGDLGRQRRGGRWQMRLDVLHQARVIPTVCPPNTARKKKRMGRAG